ncbi:ATP/GTP-binding protein [Streptomyces kaniharaensis]|uniref:ATP/GTP-binding protein n=1 Tax=Streptomyces kaniharaensis TaxID=212423 RepID=A0A6N7L111_9ACTN|nr:ATP/GTP-binding protein [Streptomyces kaniharaensis]MQS17532.1 ATP/GTP-binding protein [Streptomyces kaniharaensis]
MTSTPASQHDDNFLLTVLHAAQATWSWLSNAANWLSVNGGLVFLLTVPFAIAAAVVHRRLARKALTQRQRFVLTPTRRFNPSAEDIWRQAALVLRAASKGPWWAPRATRRVRIRLRADGSTPLEYSLEAHADAATLLAESRYQEVTVAKADPAEDPYAAQVAREREERKARRGKKKTAPASKAQPGRKKGKARDDEEVEEEKKEKRLHVVRAEFVLRGKPAASLREVPLEPDPLQPVLDAVADIQADSGELAEVVLDVQSIPRWQLRLRRWQLLHEAREKGRAQARKAAGHAAADAAEAQDSWRYQLATLFEPNSARRGPYVSAPRPQPLDVDKALGRLASSRGLVRIQLLVRCASTLEGRARQNMIKLTAAMDVFGEDSRLGPDGGRFLWMTWGADSWHRRSSFDQRWTTGEVAPRKPNWLSIGELQGLLKPPTLHARVPVLASELPTYEPGESLVPAGYLERADGKSRLTATKAEETLFTVTVGKASFGKTELAKVRALALALAGEGVLFIDPHGDTWRDVAPYLAHPDLAGRVVRIDLARAEAPGARMPAWNMLGMDRQQHAARVASSAVDALATALSWTDAAAPRAITILTKSCEALVTYNQAVVAAERPEAQATLFQVRTLLTDKRLRDAVLEFLPAEQQVWWKTVFASYPTDVLGPVTNPLDRLAANPVTRAFLGSPVGSYDIRRAMDEGKVVWLCLEGTGPSDRLLASMIMQDILRAGLSRRDTPEDRRRPFNVFADELISLDTASGTTFAEMVEQLRKFMVRLHVMVQHLDRVSAPTQRSLLQNSSALSTTAGAMAAIRLVADEWHGAVDPATIADLRKYEHYMQVTVDGKKVGPLKLRGPQVEVVFKDYASPDRVNHLTRTADQAAQAPVGAAASGRCCRSGRGAPGVPGSGCRRGHRPKATAPCGRPGEAGPRGAHRGRGTGAADPAEAGSWVPKRAAEVEAVGMDRVSGLRPVAVRVRAGRRATRRFGRRAHQEQNCCMHGGDAAVSARSGEVSFSALVVVLSIRTQDNHRASGHHCADAEGRSPHSCRAVQPQGEAAPAVVRISPASSEREHTWTSSAKGSTSLYGSGTDAHNCPAHERFSLGSWPNLAYCDGVMPL